MSRSCTVGHPGKAIPLDISGGRDLMMWAERAIRAFGSGRRAVC